MKDGLSGRCKVCASIGGVATRKKTANKDKMLPDSKYCARCNKIKLEKEFNKNKYEPSGLCCYCKVCDKERRDWKGRILTDKQKDNQSKQQRRKKYNLTTKELDYLLSVGKCEICGEIETNLSKPLHIDHNHTTKQVRGILCLQCNTAIGSLKVDDYGIDLLCSAISYLRNKDEAVC